jgi:hypothetical protein
VLEVKGKAVVVESEDSSRPAAIYSPIYGDERLVVAKDAKVTLVFRSDGHIEQVVAPGTFVVTKKGCQPRTGVQAVAMSEQDSAVVAKISKGPRGIVQGGVVMVRSPAPAPARKDNGSSGESKVSIVLGPGAIRPIADSTLLAAKPAFCWPTVPEAKEYTLKLYFRGNLVWSAVSKAPRLEYSGDVPLTSGAMYTWEVTTSIDGKPAMVCDSMFHMSSDAQRAAANALERLLAQPEPAYLAMAAIWYKLNGLVDEAIAMNEQLAKLAPGAAIYRELADLYFQAGREKDAEAAEAKATEWEKKEEGGRGKAEGNQ